VSTKQAKTPFPRLFAALIIGQVGLYIATLTPLVLLLTFKVMAIDPHHATYSFGMVSGVGALLALLGNPIGGFLSDRTRLKFGRRKAWILIGNFLGAGTLIVIALATSVLMVGIFWALACVFFNFSMASYTALIPDQVDESKRGSLSGILGVVTIVSTLVGMVLMTALGSAPLIIKWGLLAVICMASGVISCLMIKDSEAERRPVGSGRASLAATISKVYPSPRKYPIFTWGLITRFCVTVAYCSGGYNAMMLMQRYHFSQAKTTQMVTLLSTLGMLFLACSSILGGLLSDKLKRQKPFVMFSPIVVCIGLIINAFAPSFTYIMIGFSLTGLGYGIYTAVDLALIARILPRKEDAAKDFGLMNIANTLPQSIVPFFAPLLLSIGSWAFYFCVLAIFGLFSALAVIPIPEMSPNRKDTTADNQKMENEVSVK
jgi:Major Facilitator Superfamily.